MKIIWKNIRKNFLEMNTQELWSAREVGKTCISNCFLNVLICKSFLHDTGFKGIKWVWREVKFWQYMIRLRPRTLAQMILLKLQP